MLERREAELREAMKLRHSLTTLLHALRTDMQQVMEHGDHAVRAMQRNLHCSLFTHCKLKIS